MPALHDYQKSWKFVYFNVELYKNNEKSLTLYSLIEQSPLLIECSLNTLIEQSRYDQGDHGKGLKMN